MDALTPPGIWAAFPGDPDYPAELTHLHDPPSPLYLRGDASILTRPRVTIVGSRRCTAYGRRVARELARIAVESGCTVLSGMALGIDAAAHAGALDAGGLTGAVLGSGPDLPSPASHSRLMERVLERGVVVSEYAPGVGARPHHFPRRNRILAALADKVVIVEAALRSGALITAAQALELGREVWAVPGPIFSPGSPGTLRLIRDGAIPVTSLDDWRDALGGVPAAAGAPVGVASALAGSTAADGGGAHDEGALQLPLGLDGEGLAARVWDALDMEPLSVSQLVGLLDGGPADVLAALTRLELGGWVERADGHTYRRRAA